jgi:heat shock protein HslJ
MTRRHVLLLALPLSLSIVAAGCGDDDDDDDSAASGLDSTGWVLDDRSLGMETPEEMQEITISFTETDVAGNSGCNNYTSTYTTPGEGEIKFAEFVTTRMACDPAVMDVETAYLAQLADVVQYEIDGDELVLSGDAGIELRYTEGGGD